MNEEDRDPFPFPSYITPDVELAMYEIAAVFARNAIEQSPENTVMVANAIETQLKARLPEFAKLAQVPRNSIMAGVYYSIGAQVYELLPSLRRMIADHYAECGDHSEHSLRIRFDDDKPELVS